MKATEFRIGNLVHPITTASNGLSLPATGVVYKICAISLPGIVEACMLGEIPSQLKEWQKIKPASIPMTEEWLVKFGITPIPQNDAFQLPKIKPYLITLSHHNSNIFALGMRNEFGAQEHISEHQIKYVHQLQNLYFALTGEELIIQN